MWYFEYDLISRETSIFHIKHKPPLRPERLTPKAFGKPSLQRNSCERWALILTLSTMSRISRTASDRPQPRQFRHKRFIVLGRRSSDAPERDPLPPVAAIAVTLGGGKRVALITDDRPKT
jgi:hypothetical protein